MKRRGHGKSRKNVGDEEVISEKERNENKESCKRNGMVEI